MTTVNYDSFVHSGYATITNGRKKKFFAVFNPLWKFVSMICKYIFDNSSKRIVFLQNFFYPIINRSVCEVSINHPTTTKRFCNFMLKAFRVVEKDAPEKVNGIVTCIEISTGERDYWQTRTIVMHALIVTFFICFKIWKAHNANR